MYICLFILLFIFSFVSLYWLNELVLSILLVKSVVLLLLYWVYESNIYSWFICLFISFWINGLTLFSWLAWVKYPNFIKIDIILFGGDDLYTEDGKHIKPL